MKVYVADRYANFRKLLVEMLQHAGYEVIATDDGNALLAMIFDSTPDAVVADVGLAGLSALDVLTELRQAGLRVPAVILTTDSPDQVELAAAHLGAVRVLRKPFKLEALQQALRELAKG